MGLLAFVFFMLSTVIYYAFFKEDNQTDKHQVSNIEQLMSYETPSTVNNEEFTPIRFHIKRENIRVTLGEPKSSIKGQDFFCSKFLKNKEQCQVNIRRGLSFAQISLTISNDIIRIISIGTNDKDISDGLSRDLGPYLEHFELESQNGSNLTYFNKNTAIELSKMDGPIFHYRVYAR